MIGVVSWCLIVVAAVVPPAVRSAVSDGEEPPLLTDQKLSPALRTLVAAGRKHAATGSLRAAGCDVALVMTGAKYNRFVELRYKKAMPHQAEDPAGLVVWCQRRATTPPSCKDLAPIFVRVARPKRPFRVFSGYVAPPFAPRCAATYAADGTLVSGVGPEYPSR
jgi:hypothetical protein